MRKARIASSLAAGVASEVANKIFPLLTLHFAAERLGLKSFGVSQFAQWLLDIAIFFVVFGYNGWGMIAWRNTAASDRRELFASAVCLRMAHALLAGVLLVTAIGHHQSWDVYQAVVVQSLFVLFTAALDGVWAMTALNILPLLSALSIVSKTLSLVFIFAFVRGEQDSMIYTVSIMAANALVSLGSFAIVVRRVGWRWPSRKRLIDSFVGAVPFALSFFLLIGLERFDLAIVERFVGPVGAGSYSGPLKIAQSMIPIAGMVTTVFFAEMLGVSEGEHESMLRHLRAGLRVAILLLSPVIAGIWFVDTAIVRLVLGPAFVEHATLLSIMTTSVMAQMLILAFGNQILAMRGKVNQYNIAMGMGLVIGVAVAVLYGNSAHLNYFAFASSVGRWTAAIVIMLMSMHALGAYRGIIWEILRSAFPAIVMASVLYAFGSENFVVNILLGAAVYGVVTLIAFRDTAQRVLRRVQKSF